MNKLSITLILFLISIGNLYSQERMIKGRVIAENLEILPFASIMVNDTIEVGKPDVNGYFQINVPVSEQKIIFICVGFEVTHLSLDEKCNEVEVIMMDAVTYDFITLKRVDKLRKKRFNNLSKLHKEAFKKGIFKTDKACYKQEFIPYYKKK
ncbi:carboxypeptidase-like regulatory domain-containing protein [Arcicella aquatica]|uniref:Carboxypeptidase-like regulatory domain-containing protein n=1 Tax=Arcicella aquatica TaxID=217141 RepID=A0ABU5QTR8_9BACT|nr:carboxypeptidase-like regulatory domain-containing protein [Arcicella aquatica]MEA5260240.1 carboxypeptidase-like regulatory domain-containing protein [Arcicella aquatica]